MTFRYSFLLKETDVGNASKSIHNDRSKEIELIDKSDELRKSILSILVGRRFIVVLAQ